MWLQWHIKLWTSNNTVTCNSCATIDYTVWLREKSPLIQTFFYTASLSRFWNKTLISISISFSCSVVTVVLGAKYILSSRPLFRFNTMLFWLLISYLQLETTILLSFFFLELFYLGLGFFFLTSNVKHIWMMKYENVIVFILVVRG